VVGFVWLLPEVGMPNAWLRSSLIALLPVLFALLTAGCGKGNGGGESTSAYSVKGVVTYKRPPIKTDDHGYPLGLDMDPEKFETLPLRGATVRAVWSMEETLPGGSTEVVWHASGSVTTNEAGYYYIDLEKSVRDDTLPVFVEVQSVFHVEVGNGERYNMRVLADPSGMNSTVPQADRLLYSLRKGLDGSAPENNPIPAVAQAGKTVLDFEIGLDDKWWVAHQVARFAPEAKLETNGTGSRVAAIIDAAFKAALVIGDPTLGGALDLHYLRGRTERQGTYVEYDRDHDGLPYYDDKGRFLAFDPAGAHYFGSVRGGSLDNTAGDADDAWHEGALLSMMARNILRRHPAVAHFGHLPRKFQGFDKRNLALLAHLQPTMALAEGLPDAMAAVILGTPFLTSASSASGPPTVRDIRDIKGLPSDVYSGAALAAFAWELALKLNGIDSPGTPETWNNIAPSSMNYFFALAYKSVTDEGKSSASYSDLPSVFTQVSMLSSVFNDTLTDETVAQLAAPFFGEGFWPRPEEGPLSSFVTDWGNPFGEEPEPIPSFSFSMADATLDAEGRFSNLTAKENHVAKVTLTKDTNCLLSMTSTSSLPSGASIEVRIVECIYNSGGGTYERAFAPLFFGPSDLVPSDPKPQRVVLRGTSGDTTYHMLYFSLKSPTTRVPDTRVTVRLAPAY